MIYISGGAISEVSLLPEVRHHCCERNCGGCNHSDRHLGWNALLYRGTKGNCEGSEEQPATDFIYANADTHSS